LLDDLDGGITSPRLNRGRSGVWLTA
jgi:hypothetical protein